MPWALELFSAPVVAKFEEQQQQKEVATLPYFTGLLTGELDALIGSFSGEPELHDPLRGRVKGAGAFTRYVRDMNAWFDEFNISIEDVDHLVLTRGGVEEHLLHVETESGRIDIPMAVAADRSDGRVDEVRIYHSTWPLNGRHVNRPPVLQPDPELSEPDVVGEYQRALAAGDVDAIVATFEPDGYAREPAGGGHVHRGRDGLRAFYELLFSNGGGIPLEHCAVIDDGRACALEYNVARWGRTELRPQAGVAVYVRGENGKLAAARIYDDADPPLAGAS